MLIMELQQQKKRGRPKLPPGQKKVRVEIVVSPDTLVRVDAAAGRRGISRSAMIEALILRMR